MTAVFFGAAFLEALVNEVILDVMNRQEVSPLTEWLAFRQTADDRRAAAALEE